MLNESLTSSDAFAKAACKLIKEYMIRLESKKQYALRILDQIRAFQAPTEQTEYLRKRYMQEYQDFVNSREAYEKLIRKSSQWIEHGKLPQPSLELELEVRLADFEDTLRMLGIFFQSNMS